MLDVEVCNNFNGRIVFSSTTYEVFGSYSLDDVNMLFDKFYSLIVSRSNSKVIFEINGYHIHVTINDKFIKVYYCQNDEFVNIECTCMNILMFPDKIVINCKSGSECIFEKSL